MCIYIYTPLFWRVKFTPRYRIAIAQNKYLTNYIVQMSAIYQLQKQTLQITLSPAALPTGGKTRLPLAGQVHSKRPCCYRFVQAPFQSTVPCSCSGLWCRYRCLSTLNWRSWMVSSGSLTVITSKKDPHTIHNHMSLNFLGIPYVPKGSTSWSQVSHWDKALKFQSIT